MSFFWIEALGKPFNTYRLSPLFHWQNNSDYYNRTAHDLSLFFSELLRQSQNSKAASPSKVIVSPVAALDNSYIPSIIFRVISRSAPAQIPFLAVLCGGRKEDQTLSYASYDFLNL